MNRGIKPVNLYGPSQVHTYTTVCGMDINTDYIDTINKREVTCKRCKKTKVFMMSMGKRNE